MLTLKVFIEDGGKAPQKGKHGDAGLDVFAHISEPLVVRQGETAKIPLGFRYALVESYDYPGLESVYSNYYLEVRNRSGVGLRSGFTELASICDAGYRGVPHYCVAKVTPDSYTINPGDKIAQILIHPFIDPMRVAIEVVSSIEELGITDRGATGFGHSGT